MKKTLKEIFLENGMKESEIDTHESDLYVLVNDISKKIVNEYEFKNNVTTFKSQIDNKLWYDIPFGDFENFIKEKK